MTQGARGRGYASARSATACWPVSADDRSSTAGTTSRKAWDWWWSGTMKAEWYQNKGKPAWCESSWPEQTWKHWWSSEDEHLDCRWSDEGKVHGQCCQMNNAKDLWHESISWDEFAQQRSRSQELTYIEEQRSDRSSSSDSVPDMERDLVQSTWLAHGAAVELKGLRQFERFNGVIGQLVDFDDTWCYVQLPAVLGGIVLAVHRKYAQPLRAGAVVAVAGLPEAHLNGQTVTVQFLDEPGLDHHSACYVVRFQDGHTCGVHPTQLRAQSRLCNVRFDPEIPQWREQKSYFVDRNGKYRMLCIHLPSQLCKCAAPPWPMLVYMPGTGGGTFFERTWCNLRSRGMRFAARNFVVVTPVCEWSWFDSPDDWCIELVRVLRAASWIDHERVYLTGCSMGGMGAWELGAQAPELFAAVAPVAAHHKTKLEEWIAARLGKKPVFAMHSATDETCQLEWEEPLWMRFDNSVLFHKYIVPYTDHLSMFEEAYCKSSELYEWLLQCSLQGTSWQSSLTE